MSKTKELVINSLKYFDENQEKNIKLTEKFKRYSLNRFDDNDIEHARITFYNEYNEKLAEYKYEILGIYYITSKNWSWSWAIPNLKKKYSYIAKKTFNYGLDLDPELEDIYIRAELITSRFSISSDIQIDIHVALASYISKQPFIFKLIIEIPHSTPVEGSENIFPVVANIKQNYQIYYLYITEEL